MKGVQTHDVRIQVVNKAVRLANIVPCILGKTLNDVQFKGYTIPAGWGLMVCPLAVHLNPNIYLHPLIFSASKFKVLFNSNI
ncbi:cytochrome P450 87A3-like isoform X2 [Lolium perenne]|uniref:cytochrome P450 87A3-like isoform X2 n=1 Tax=Lolium perenne TaxID=4522 RepID=UPI003A98F6C6